MGDDGVHVRVPHQRLGLRAGQVDRARSPRAGHAEPSASSTSAPVRRAREEGRARTALPPASAEAATTVGTHTGELAACQPSTTP